MSEQPLQGQGSLFIPSPEHARVADAMRYGVLSCFPDASLRAAARTMALHHIHTLVVSDPDDGKTVGVVSDGDLLGALTGAEDGQRTVEEVARRDFVTVDEQEPLLDALAEMHRHRSAHALVVDAGGGRPTGMLSTLDALGMFAWGEG